MELPETTGQKVRQTEKKLAELDLTKIEGNGDFPCPTCAVMISPEDESEDVYTIIEEKVNDDILEQLVIECNACGCRIRLTGFSSLDMVPSEND